MKTKNISIKEALKPHKYELHFIRDDDNKDVCRLVISNDWRGTYKESPFVVPASQVNTDVKQDKIINQGECLDFILKVTGAKPVRLNTFEL